MARKWLRKMGAKVGMGAGAGKRGLAVMATAACVGLAGFVGLAGQGAQARTHRADVSRHADAATLTVESSELPREAVDTLHLIAAGGPFPYEKDGVVFGNFERLLPPQRRGYYHEYTVPTPRARNRGARRIVCGGPPKRIDNCYYSDDHYASFKRIVE